MIMAMVMTLNINFIFKNVVDYLYICKKVYKTQQEVNDFA